MAIYRQIDWILQADTNLQDHVSVDCLFCGEIIWSFVTVGRPARYCSNACKMRAYRLRLKALRNSQSVESASNTHTKQWIPTVNSQKGQV